MKTYTFEKTSNPNLFRVVDLNGDWKNYYHKPTQTYLRAVNDIINTGYAKGKQFEIWLKGVTPEQAEKKLKEAGERGDKVHKAIDYLFANEGKISRETLIWNDDTKVEERMENDEWECVLAFQSFWQRHLPVLVSNEYAVFNLSVGYAGTLDAMLTLTKGCENPKCGCHKVIGKLGLWDWKSSSGIRDSYGAQTAAYANADEIEKPKYTAILRLGTNHKIGYEMEVYDDKETRKHWHEFLAAQTISNSSYKPFDPDREIIDIPNEVFITLSKPKVKKKRIKKSK